MRVFEPLKMGDLELPHRVIMAPLTRCRAGVGRVPNDLMLEYYVQRASAGMILSEATSVSPQGVGYPDTPGIWSREQVAGWKKITNGYLPDQFLRDGSNQRTDDYGGSLENRARFLLEATGAAIEVWGASRVGVHLSPRNGTHGAYDSDVATTFGYVCRELGKRKVAFLCVRESLNGGERFGPMMKREFGGAYIVNEDFSPEQAERVLESGEADAVAWGKMFIANPDLPRRFEIGAELNEGDPSTFYAPGPHGYTDYPAL